MQYFNYISILPSYGKSFGCYFKIYCREIFTSSWTKKLRNFLPRSESSSPAFLKSKINLANFHQSTNVKQAFDKRKTNQQT